MLKIECIASNLIMWEIIPDDDDDNNNNNNVPLQKDKSDDYVDGARSGVFVYTW